MDSLYSDEIRRYINTRSWPKRIVWEVIEYEGYLGFRLFRDNFNAFDGEDRMQIAMMVKEIMEKIRKDGVPIYMEVAAGNGRAKE